MKYLNKEIARHGKTVYYFRKAGEPRIRLPDALGSPEFFQAYGLALEGRACCPAKSIASVARALSVSSCLEECLKRARSRAREKRLAFDLNLLWLKAEVESNNYACAVTRIPFRFIGPDTRKIRNPFAPSIDRVDSALGYTRDNARVVLYAFNIMLSDWGESVFESIGAAYFENKKRTSIPVREARVRDLEKK